VRLEDVA